ncbi:MAG: hypothetical protein BWY73_00420 [candidate division TA06 bacterium ADurb.Bin417]|uniref:Uncharacterized protein n=1 Tax=candidate division TA06 bacterium ADurb.Bin417 TaxID=1852828 RepID=A0A1V5MJ36_UNCT6|nr:MAG: hypothetical protein BWY73_00420 [candidate division TA06 bacterium ADurb.Bin417]
MADGQVAGQLFERLRGEDLGRFAHAQVGPDLAAVGGGDAGALLPPVLQGVKAQEGHFGGRFVPVNPEDPALLPELHYLNMITEKGIF